MQKIRRKFPDNKTIIGYSQKVGEVERTHPPYGTDKEGVIVSAMTNTGTEWIANFSDAEMANDFVTLLQSVYSCGFQTGIGRILKIQKDMISPV